MDVIILVVYIVAIIAFFYFVMIRPEKKRKQKLEEMRNSIEVGDDITTIGGIMGTVVSENQNKIVIETGADRVRIELARWAISSKGKGEENEEDAEKADSSSAPEAK